LLLSFGGFLLAAYAQAQKHQYSQQQNEILFHESSSQTNCWDVLQQLLNHNDYLLCLYVYWYIYSVGKLLFK